MSHPRQLIHEHVQKVHESKQIVDVHALAAELHEHCSGMTIEEIERVILEHVTTLGAGAVLRKPNQ